MAGQRPAYVEPPGSVPFRQAWQGPSSTRPLDSRSVAHVSRTPRISCEARAPAPPLTMRTRPRDPPSTMLRFPTPRASSASSACSTASWLLHTARLLGRRGTLGWPNPTGMRSRTAHPANQLCHDVEECPVNRRSVGIKGSSLARQRPAYVEPPGSVPFRQACQGPSSTRPLDSRAVAHVSRTPRISCEAPEYARPLFDDHLAQVLPTTMPRTPSHGASSASSACWAAAPSTP